MRLGEAFLTNRGLCLGDFSFRTDPGRVECTGCGNIVFYHYTREERVEQILAPNSGLFARLPVDVCPNPPEEFKGCFMAEGFLEPLPTWLTHSPYYGDLGIEMVKKYIGNTLLRIEVPDSFEGLFIADYAHNLEVNHLRLRGSGPLNLGYDYGTGKEVTQAYVNSYIPVAQYKNAHIGPVMQATRKERGIVIPSEYVTLASLQPLG